MSDYYRLSWEMVSQRSLHLFCNADPLLYKNVTQTVPNSQIPDEHWHPVSRETSDPWQQYHQLKKWADGDEQFVRNVVLEKQDSKPTWTRVIPPATTKRCVGCVIDGEDHDCGRPDPNQEVVEE